MTTAVRFSGVLAPVVTPFNRDLSANAQRLVEQCRWLLSKKVGLAVFGTNSEANSMSTGEKIELLDALLDAGIESAKLMPGTGCCAITDTVQLTRHAAKLGCGGVLMLPPFYYKNVSDDGLFRSYSEVIERVGDNRLRIYLYHIPPVAQVGLSLELVERLVVRYPDTVVGIKDSSGDWSNTEALIERGWDDFRVFAGSEAFLLQNMRAGGAGCISATANINPAAIHQLYASWQSASADAQQQQLNELRQIMQSFPMIPALKAVIARYSRQAEWSVVRPPLEELAGDAYSKLISVLEKRGFGMPGLTD
ncbi:MAG: dihydrodipicolinate synthase family protein [Gammaproteobacteria bacterium]|nr:dihydrodipicolinate synthase family protein [Gammaproteobacteria bacterium]MDH5215768.1 dihydrodipicolinate synthase family protein [Gammaproteobacteria bacterium]